MTEKEKEKGRVRKDERRGQKEKVLRSTGQRDVGKTRA